MGALVRSYIAFGSHANISPLDYGSPFSPTMSLRKSFILLLNFMLAISLRNPLYISSCDCIFMSFGFLLEIYASSLTLIYLPYKLILSHVYPSRAFLYIFCILICHFLLGGDAPPSVVILHMFHCIEHRYVPLLGTSLFVP